MTSPGTRAVSDSCSIEAANDIDRSKCIVYSIFSHIYVIFQHHKEIIIVVIHKYLTQKEKKNNIVYR